MQNENQFFPHAQSWLLDGLDEGDKRLVSGILAARAAQFLPAGFRGSTRDLAQGEALTVEHGFVVVRSWSPSGRQIVVAEAGPGSIVLAPSDGDHLHALTDSWMTVLPLDVLEGLLAVPAAATTLFRAVGTALRLRQEGTTYLASVRHADRVRQKLLQLAREFGKVHPDGVRLEFPLTHDLLAEMVASARETITRALDELQRSGFLVREGHTYRLLISPEALDDPGRDLFSGSTVQ